MYCSTCGAYVPAGRSACTECGTQLALRAPRAASPVLRYGSEDRRWITEPAVGMCPRCRYQGEGLPYFSRGTHVALLVGITVITGGMMGIGGLVYYLVRRDHRICPRCGRSWGRAGEMALVPSRAGRLRESAAPLPATVPSGSAKRGWSIFLFVLAAILLIVGIVEAEAVAALFGAVAAGGGYLLHRAANEERAARRAAILTSLQQPVLKLAAEHNGRLTVTGVAAHLGWSLPRAEKVLESLNDGLRVDSEVTDEGVIVYEFRELMNLRKRLPETGS